MKADFVKPQGKNSKISVVIGFIALIFMMFIGYLIGVLDAAEPTQNVPQEAIELWQTIEKVCVKNDLVPEVETGEGYNGNLFFYITCKPSNIQEV